ncbi:MAG: ArnT family glycosyltransferase [Anaerolineae bacterium]
MVHSQSTAPGSGGSARAGRIDVVIVVGLVLLAGVVRLPGLDRVPPGLHFDEAFNALDALGVLEGNTPLFFEGNFGREPLFHYLLAVAFWLFGPSPATVRGVAALAGTLAVPLTYGIGRQLFPGSRWPALLGALVQVALPWDLHFSRYGLRVELLPLLGSAAMLCLLLGWRSRRRLWYIASGAFLGLSLYGYMAARLLPLVVVVWGALALLCTRPGERRRVLLGLALLALTALLVFAPLGAYFLQHPASFGHRAGQVLLKGDEQGGRLASFAGNAWLWAKAFLVEGDQNPRNNLPGAPALTPWLALPALIGAAQILRPGRRLVSLLLLIWMGIMLLPSVLTDYAPSFQRAIGAVPPLCLLLGLGLWRLGELARRVSGRQWAAAAVVGILFLGHTGQALHQYFVRWGRSNALYYAFDEGIYALGQYMREATLAGHQVYLSPVRPDHATLHFVMRGLGGPATFDGRETFVLPPDPGRPTQYLVLVGEDPLTITKVRAHYPEATEERVFRDRAGRPYAVALLGREMGPATEEVIAGAPARWETGIELRDLRVQVKPPFLERLAFEVLWSTDAPQEQDYTVFVHLIGPPNPETGTPLWCQSDSMPGSGTYPTSLWRPGEVVVDSHILNVPETLADGEYYIEIGWYLLSTGERLRLVEPEAGADRLLLGPFQVQDGRVQR